MEALRRQLGARIKEARKLRGLTQEALAEKAESSHRYLSRLEVGQQSPSLETLASPAGALDLELSELFEFGHQGTPKEVRERLRRLIQEADEPRLCLALKLFRAFAQ